jgi:hypothetical protein
MAKEAAGLQANEPIRLKAVEAQPPIYLLPNRLPHPKSKKPFFVH